MSSLFYLPPHLRSRTVTTSCSSPKKRLSLRSRFSSSNKRIHCFRRLRQVGDSLTHKDLCVLYALHPGPQSMNQEGKECHLKAAIEKAAIIVEAPVKAGRRDAENPTMR